MHKLSLRKLAGLAFVAGATICTIVPAAQAEIFNITIKNLSQNVLTPAAFITHDASFDLFDEGVVASGNLERLAEDGLVAGVLAQANVALGAGVLDFEVAGAGPIHFGNSAMVTIEADPDHPWLSFASMAALSNDAFIGGAYEDGAINLFPGGSRFIGELVIQSEQVWDAGTEVNDELTASVPGLGAGIEAGTPEGQVIKLGHYGIKGIGDIPLSANWVGGSVAAITIVPEPSTLSMLAAIGSVGLLALIRRRRRITDT